jgi:hypothetical protein
LGGKDRHEKAGKGMAGIDTVGLVMYIRALDSAESSGTGVSTKAEISGLIAVFGIDCRARPIAA